MAEEGHPNPPLIAIQDELTEVRRILDEMINNPGTDQAMIALETIVYKFHTTLHRLNEELAAPDPGRVPFRPPDGDLQQRLMGENDQLKNKIRQLDAEVEELSRVNTDWNVQYRRNKAKFQDERQQMEAKILEQDSKLELLSVIRPQDDLAPSQEQLAQLINEKEEAMNRVMDLSHANSKLRKRLETQDLLIQEDEQNAEAVEKLVKELKEKYKQKESEEIKNISEYKGLHSRYNELKDQHEFTKKSESETKDKLKKAEYNLKNKEEAIDKAKKEYKTLQAKVILGLLGEEKTEPKKKEPKKTPKKVWFHNRRPYCLESDISDFYDPEFDILTHRPRKYRTPKLATLTDWDKDFETLDYPHFGSLRRPYYTVDSD